MSGRISEERLALFRRFAKFGREAGSKLVEVSRAELDFVADEIEQSRALVTELRALAERTRIDRDALAGIDHYRDVYQERDGFLEDLNALLAAHDAQQAEGRE